MGSRLERMSLGRPLSCIVAACETRLLFTFEGLDEGDNLRMEGGARLEAYIDCTRASRWDTMKRRHKLRSHDACRGQ